MTAVPSSHLTYLQRAYQLARIAGRVVGRNPNVGAVLVYKNRIIGEGYHQKYGEAHAEVNAIANVKPSDLGLIKDAVFYVSLEPCCIHSKTPPCTSAIIKEGIKEVHVGTIDPFVGIAGKGIALLREHGVNVVVHDDAEAQELIAPFVTYHTQKRPHITLKWAKSKHNYMGSPDQQVWFTNELTNVHTHQLRDRMDAILIGTNTAILDNPTLTTRHIEGRSPLRLVIDMEHRIPLTSKLLSDDLPTIIFTLSAIQLPPLKDVVIVESRDTLFDSILAYCYTNGIVNLLVEGGATLLKSFIKAQLWDDAMIIQTQHELSAGIKGPNLHGNLVRTTILGNDEISLVKAFQ